jgi:transposase InsO family protein
VPRRGHAQGNVEHVGTVGLQGGWACSFYLPPAAEGDDTGRSDADLRAWLRAYAVKHPCHGFRRAWAALVSQALQRFCENKVRMSYIPPGTPWNNGYIESFNNRLSKECLNRSHWNTLFEARVVIGDFKDEHNTRHRHSALGYRTPAEYAAACAHDHYAMACEIN